MSSEKTGLPPPSDTTTTEKPSTPFSFNRILLKAKYSLYSAIIFFIFANPETTLILQRIFGNIVDFITPCGGPTVLGIFFSTGLFFFTMLGLMLLPSD
jgi:hypothetical protein